MTIYATRDADADGYIEEDARIFTFESLPAAEAYLREQYEGSDIIVTAIEPGAYGDCWFKTLKKPEPRDYRPFGEDDVILRGPGGHPGGYGWWVEPRPDVLVAVGRLREECL